MDEDKRFPPELEFERTNVDAPDEITEAWIKATLAGGVKTITFSFASRDVSTTFREQDEQDRARVEQAGDRLLRRGLLPFVYSPQTGRESWGRWKARRILSKCDLTTDSGRHAAMDAALDYEAALTVPTVSRDMLAELVAGLEIPEDMLLEEVAAYRKRKAEKNRADGYRLFFEQGAALLTEGKVDEARELLEEQTPRLRALAGAVRRVEPYTLAALEQDVARTLPGLKTGYPSLNALLTIPQEAVTIIGGRPSHGKTTFMLNLCRNMVREYPGKTFVFFSYEMTRKQIGVALLNILSGDLLSEHHNLGSLEGYLRGSAETRAARPKIEEGKAEFEALARAGRLLVTDEPLFVDELADALSSIKEERDVGAVFVDYIQKVKIKGRFPTRQVELQKVSERIRETAASLSVPIILGAQFGRDKDRADKVRLDNLREAGDIEQDAWLVLGLFNPAMEKVQAGGESIPDRRNVELKLSVLKNRSGAVNEETALFFDMPLSTVREKTVPSYGELGNGKRW